jgi:hypothetical protein
MLYSAAAVAQVDWARRTPTMFATAASTWRNHMCGQVSGSSVILLEVIDQDDEVITRIRIQRASLSGFKRAAHDLELRLNIVEAMYFENSEDFRHWWYQR